jgi:F0F1-type ATP synthase assembly protein I
MAISIIVACFDVRLAVSVFCGGLVALVGQLYLALRLFQRSVEPRRVLFNFYRGIVGRFVLMAILLWVLLMSHTFVAGGLLIGFIVALLAAGFNPLWICQYARMRSAT